MVVRPVLRRHAICVIRVTSAARSDAKGIQARQARDQGRMRGAARSPNSREKRDIHGCIIGFCPKIPRGSGTCA